MKASRRLWRSAIAERSRLRRSGLSDTANAGEPAYPPWPHSVCSPEGLAGGCAPSDPQLQTSRRERREVGQSMACQWPPKGSPATDTP